MRKGILRRKIRIKSTKILLASLVLLFIGTFFVYQIIRNIDAEAVVGLPNGISFFIAGISLIAGAFLFYRAIMPLFDIKHYVYVKRLPKNAELSSVEEEFLNAPPDNSYRIAGNLYYRNKFFLTKDWLIVETFWNLRIYSAGKIVWAYMKTEGVEMQSSISFKKTKIDLKTVGGSFSATGDENSINSLLCGLEKAYPWVITKYTLALEKQWQNERDTFVKHVKEKMKEAGYLDII